VTPTSANAARQPAPELDLAFRLETTDGDPLPTSLAGLLREAGPLADVAQAEQHWHDLLASWLVQLAPELPADLRGAAYSLGLMLTDDASITALNSTWRHRNEPTDVLSFAARESDREEGPPLPLPPGLNEEAGLLQEADDMATEDAAIDDTEMDDTEVDEEVDGLEGEDLAGHDLEGDDRDDEPGVDAEPGHADEDGDEPLELGDIVISLETAARQAEAGGTGLEAELLFLASHGLLHLLGWDHPDEPSLTAMLARQETLIRGL
jgi:rRNA maturation RNase YbeY